MSTLPNDLTLRSELLSNLESSITQDVPDGKSNLTVNNATLMLHSDVPESTQLKSTPRTT